MGMSKQGAWGEEVAKRLDSMVALRRDFHRHPELSFQEKRTSEIIAERLTKAGLEVKTGIAGQTGVVGILRGDKPGKTIAWRADIDALPLTEILAAPFTSGTKGVMHACGHDGHTAIAITAAEILAARRGELPGTSGDGFTVEVTGKGGHGAYPHLSVDPMTAAAHILIGMQSLVTKEVAAKETVVLSVGQIMAGTKNNIIPDKAVMRGTLRTFDMGVREQLLGRLQSFVSDMARAYRAEARLDLTMGCPPVINPSKETDFVHHCCVDELGETAVVEGAPVMASDDMSLFLRARPGCYFRVGISPTGNRRVPHHAPEFEMNEDGLPVGLRVALSVLRSRLGA
jgi:amidohydrolase